MIFKGKGKTFDKPTIFTTEEEFLFGDRLIPAGSECKQFETMNYGWTIAKTPKGKQIIAKE